MSVTAVTGASLWDSTYFQGSLSTEHRARRSEIVADGTPGVAQSGSAPSASVQAASVQAASVRAASVQFGNDSYTPGVRDGAHRPVQAPASAANNAVNLTGLTGSNAAVNLAAAGLVNGNPLLMLGGTNGAAANSGAGVGQGQAQAGTSQTGDGGVLSQLDAAISAAATDGSQDSNWMDDLVSYASGLGGGPTAAGGANGGGALSSDLNAIEGVIQKVTSQVSSALAAQGASPGLLSAAVNALTTSLTLNSLGAVAQQIAARTGNPNAFTVTSSVVTMQANGTNSTASVNGQQESFSGANGSLALATMGGTASLINGGGAAGNGASLNSEGFGYSFSISESGPGGNAFAGTTEVEAAASETSTNGAGGSVSSSAALAEGATVYENESVNGAGSNSAMVLMSDWEANLESTATQNTQNTANVPSGTQGQPAQSGTSSLADFFSAAAHALFKHAVALLESLFGVGNSNAAGQAGDGHLVDVYA